MENVCRTCLRSPDKLVSLFDDASLPLKISVISSILVDIDDNLPNTICGECISNINLSYNFRKVIINSDLELKERYAALKETEYHGTVSHDTEVNTDADEANLIEEIVANDDSTVDKMSIGDDNCSNISEDNTTENYEQTPEHNEKTQNENQRITFKNIMIYRKKLYQCKSCNFSCTESSKWQNHKRTNHYMPGICNICGKTMRTDNLQRHIKSHTEPPVTCTECGKIFKNTESLRSHNLIHSGTEYICNLCGKSYKYRGEYNRHIKRHASNGVKTVQCSVCEKFFYDQKHMKKHLQTHTGERPHICQYCQRGFSSRYALKTHIRQHTNEKPYICEYCPMAFHQKISLTTHIQSKHSINADIDDVKD